jgi:hypothetical protein
MVEPPSHRRPIGSANSSWGAGPKVEVAVSPGIIGRGLDARERDLLGALIGGTAAGSQLLPDSPTPVSAHTYLLQPDEELAG